MDDYLDESALYSSTHELTQHLWAWRSVAPKLSDRIVELAAAMSHWGHWGHGDAELAAACNWVLDLQDAGSHFTKPLPRTAVDTHADARGFQLQSTSSGTSADEPVASRRQQLPENQQSAAAQSLTGPSSSALNTTAPAHWDITVARPATAYFGAAADQSIPSPSTPAASVAERGVRWLKHHFRDVVLIVNFNTRGKFVAGNAAIYKRLYGDVFPRMFFCVNGVDGDAFGSKTPYGNRTTVLDTGDDMWHLHTWHGCYSYMCTVAAIRKHPGARGYLHTNDDTIMNPCVLARYSLESFWVAKHHGTRPEADYLMPLEKHAKDPKTWWDGQHGGCLQHWL